MRTVGLTFTKEEIRRNKRKNFLNKILKLIKKFGQWLLKNILIIIPIIISIISLLKQ